MQDDKLRPLESERAQECHRHKTYPTTDTTRPSDTSTQAVDVDGQSLRRRWRRERSRERDGSGRRHVQQHRRRPARRGQALVRPPPVSLVGECVRRYTMGCDGRCCHYHAPQWRALGPLALGLAAQALRIIHPRLSSQLPQRELPTFRRRASVDRCGGGGDSVHYAASAPDRAGPSIITEAGRPPICPPPTSLISPLARARPSAVVSEPKPLQDHF